MDIKTDHFSAPVDAATSARVNLGGSVGRLYVTAAKDDATLIDAELTYLGTVDFSVTGETEKIVKLQHTQDSFLSWLNPANWFSSAPEKVRWDVKLSAKLPMSLEIGGGLGESRLDLHDLLLREVHIGGSAGDKHVILPAHTERYMAHLSGGAGNLDVEIPAGVTVDLKIGGGFGNVSLRIGENAAVNAVIRGGAGNVVVYTPRGSAVQVNAESGMGNISIPPDYVALRTEDRMVGKAGSWESPTFKDAARQVVIDYNGGVGNFAIR